ncbi:E3 ubiquitin-protein ligase FANCL-like [Mizuhopecten yessoensis]|uniref:E3 ubiquitin-protein ligase FANCL-like n=1 Tax=Mizuhopecten yessoensis TaxID=6573 RepID=UPI000B4597E5|nr:E3 ubiquitin-protein ligase FANCL-like [Mizuhopecten yessoensis]
MDMLTTFPELIPVNKQASIYTGYININNEDYRIHIELPERKTLEELQFSCDWKLQQLLHGYTAILKQRLRQCTSLCQYLLEVKSLVERQLEGRHLVKQGGNSQVCAQLLGEVEKLGWDRLVSIDSKFQTLELQCKDKKGRQHILKVTLSPQHPRLAPKCVVDLPGQFQVQWKSTSSLEWLYQQFELAVDMYQDFIDVMEELDKNTWILEPEKPVYSATYRRIAVSTNASLQISVDHRHPRMLPECRFLGADNAVVPLRESLNSNLHLWDEQKGLLENLQSLLGTELPSPATSNKEEFSVECGICYSYRLDTELPNEACSDARCGQPFHQTCLYEWLRALPSSRQSFNTIFGDCPYCSKPIKVKMPVKR